MQVCTTEDRNAYMIVRASVLASMKQNYYKVYVAVDEAGAVLGAYCECVAG